MASLNNLLNPESSYESSLRLQAVRSPSSATTSPTEHTSESSSTAVELRQPPPRAEVVIRAHEPHPDCPDTLACLPDTDGRPQHTLPVILRCTILGSPRKRLTIREIYAAMERKYPYYKTAGPAWKQSVRHHLSLNRLFERQPRPPSDPGFGSYWTVNLEAPPGTKRPRKRGGRSNKPEGTENGPTPGLGQVLPTVIIPMQVHPPPISTMGGPPVPQPPLSATPSTTSTFMSSSNGASASSSTASPSVRAPPSHISYPPPDHHLAHHDSPHNHPQHVYSQSHPPPPPHPHEHPHMHVQSPHPQSQPQSHPHMPPPSHMHSQPPPHPHGHAHPHSVPPPHPHSMPPPHPHSQPPPVPYGHSPPPGHPHSQPPPPPPHSHIHSQPPPQPHPNTHYPHQQSHHSGHPPSHPPSRPASHPGPPPPPPSSAGPNSHPQTSVSTIAKLRPVDSRSFSQTSTMRSRRLYDDDDDDEMDWDDGDGPQYSDDDYSSSEDMPYQYDPRVHNRNSSSYSGSRRRTYSGPQGQTGKSVLHGAFSSYSAIDHPDSTIERLKMEMAGLRRQSQDAVNASLRLSDQLTASQEDAARAKTALKVAENMLEEEARRRMQAEKNTEEEVRRRRVAEEALRQYEAQVRAQRNPNAYPRS